MGKLAVKFYGQNNELNLPPEWPQESYPIFEGQLLPVGFYEMSEEEYQIHLEKHSAAYVKWHDDRTRPILNKINRKLFGPSTEQICEALLEFVSTFPNLTPKIQAILEQRANIEKEYPID